MGIVRFVLLISALSTLFVAGCSEKTEQKSGKRDKQHLVEADMVQNIKAGISQVRTGTLRARREVTVYTQEEGRVTELPLYEGDKVVKGQAVARLDDKLLRSQLARAEATKRKAEQDLKRTRDLYKKKLTTDEELTRSETDLEVARADVELLSTRLSYTVIKAPINGVVSARLTDSGNVVEKHTHLLTISDPTSLVTEVSISELLIPQISIGDPVKVKIDALGGGTNNGRIIRIYPNLDPVTRRGTVEVELKPVPDGARPGQLCRVEFATKTADRLVIPFRAIRRDDQGEYVFVVDAEKAVKRVDVKSGLRIGEQIEVLQGLESGQQVVTKGFLGLTNGKTVKIVKPQAQNG